MNVWCRHFSSEFSSEFLQRFCQRKINNQTRNSFISWVQSLSLSPYFCLYVHIVWFNWLAINILINCYLYCVTILLIKIAYTSKLFVTSCEVHEIVKTFLKIVEVINCLCFTDKNDFTFKSELTFIVTNLEQIL